MKDIEPLPGQPGAGDDESPEGAKGKFQYPPSPDDGKPSPPYWAKMSREFDELLISRGFTKTDREIILHVLRRESDERGCDSGQRDFAKFTRTHPDYVRHRMKYLVARGLIKRYPRPGRTSVLRVADKFEWLRANPLDGKKRPLPPPEESREEAKRKIRNELWMRIWALPGGEKAPRRPFEQMMDKNLAVFENVLNEMEDRVKRGLPENRERQGPNALREVKNVVGMFIVLFGEWVKAAEKAAQKRRE